MISNLYITSKLFNFNIVDVLTRIRTFFSMDRPTKQLIIPEAHYTRFVRVTFIESKIKS